MNVLRSPTRYDAILAAIPVLFVLGGAAAWTAGASARVAVVVGSVTAFLVLLEALVRNPPVGGR